MSAGDNYSTESAPFSKTLANGETWENVLIQGPGKVDIRATTNNWAIRNIGMSNVSNTDSRLVTAHVPNENGAGVIDNVYIEGDDNATNAIFTAGAHAGHIDLTNSYFSGPLEDAWYCSPPSNPDTQQWADATGKDRGQGGTAKAQNVYMSDIRDYGIRLGVGQAIDVRATNVGVAFASLYREATFQDVHAAGDGTTLRVGTPVDNNRRYTPQPVIANLRGSNEFAGGESNFDIRSGGPNLDEPGVVNGTDTVGSNPSTEVQGNIPLTPEEAASGTSTASPAPAPDGTGGDGTTATDGTGGTGGPVEYADCEFVEVSPVITSSQAIEDGATGGGDTTTGGGVDPSTFTSQEGVIGGGAGYDRTVSTSAADTTVSDAGGLQASGT